jgi:serine/threonine-protein kinase RsbW
MNDAENGIRLTCPAETENVAVVRHALAGLAEAAGMDESGIADLKTIVTEACMNVVVHAYGESGPMQVEASPADTELTVVVQDYGVGIRPKAELDRPSLRLGLPLIAALSGSFEIAGGLDRGTRITMSVPFSSNGGSKVPGSDPDREHPPDATAITVSDPDLLAPVLARVVGALAARRDLTIDRLSDAVLLTDAISAAAPRAFDDGQVRLQLTDTKAGISLKLGPMEKGSGERIREALTLPAVGGTLESLADEVSVDSLDDGEYLSLRIGSRTNS